MQRIIPFITILLLVALACNGGAAPTVPPTPQSSVFDLGRTTYGFFPSPPEVKLESIFETYKGIAEHGDFVLLQQNTAWEDFVNGVDGESQTRTDLINQVILARQNNIDYIFVTDALNGLNRREFAGLPEGWEASFANPNVRMAYKNFALWIVRQFHPRYLGLASEINTYMDAFPDDSPNFISLYNEIYTAVKAEAPETQIFVTFQWDDLNNMFPQPEEGNQQKFDTKWEQIEAFEPNLDLWVISSYPYFVFSSGADIPTDYYTPLLLRTDKPVAVAEGGYTTQNVGNIISSPQDQVEFVEAIHDQLGPRLAFWVNTLLSDFNLDSYADFMKQNGQDEEDVTTLGFFAFIGLQNFDGTPKPALELWDSYRSGE
ncbi:MAG: hypothetical protein AB1649_26535 [Chloroflexota bacterium]